MTADEWWAEATRVEAGMRRLAARRGWDLDPCYDPDGDDEDEDDAA